MIGSKDAINIAARSPMCMHLQPFELMSALQFLDEATSALDNKTEQLFLSEIEWVAKTKTVIMIAYFTTVKNCDKIYVLETGRIVA